MKRQKILLVIIILALFFYPKKATYWRTPKYYEINGGSALENYGQQCSCTGFTRDKSTELEKIEYCYGIPKCIGNI